MKKLPNKRVVKLDNLAGDPLRFSLAYNQSTPHGLPPGVKTPELAEFEATGIDGVIQRYNTSGQVRAVLERAVGRAAGMLQPGMEHLVHMFGPRPLGEYPR